VLDFQHGLGKRGIRLVHGNYIAPGRKPLTVGRECPLGLVDFHVSRGEDSESVGQACLIGLVGRNHPRFRPSLPTFHRPPVDLVEVLQPIATIPCGVVQEGHHARFHVVHYVWKSPFTPLPRPWEVPCRNCGVQTTSGPKVVPVDVDGCGDTDRGRLAQDPDAPMVVLIGPGRRESVVAIVDHHAGHPLGSQFGSHIRAELVDSGNEGRIDVLFEGIDEGWEKDPGSVGPCLMDVVDNLGVPNVVGLPNRELGLQLSEGVPIPIVVMSGVRMVEPG